MANTRHVETYKMKVDAGIGVLDRQSTPLDRKFLDRVVVFSNDLSNDDIDKGGLSMTHDNETIFDENTSGSFFRKSEYLSTADAGFKIDFDLEAEGKFIYFKFKNETAAPTGYLYITVFYRDTPFSNPRILTN